MKLDTPLRNVTRASRRLNTALFGILPLVMVLAGALYWGGQRILKQEEDKFQIDFSILVGYVNAQERMLHALHTQAWRPDSHNLVSSTHVSEVAGFDPPAWRFFEGQHALASMPFSLLCQRPDACPVENGVFTGIGPYLSDFYSSHWAASYYPAAPVFVVSPSREVSLSVPAVATDSGYEPLTRRAFTAVVEAIMAKAGGADPQESQLGSSDKVEWIRDPGLPNAMIGMLATSLPLGLRNEAPDVRRNVYAATLLSRDRISISEKVLNVPLYDQFWLARQGDGVLVGEDPPPGPDKEAGFHYAADGLVLKINDKSGTWTGYYKLKYSSLFQANMWLPVGVLLLLIVGLGLGAAYLRWYNRRVIQPAEAAHRDIVENEEFNRTVLDTAPVALCVLSRPDGKVVFSNALASQWLGIEPGGELHNSPDANQLLRRALGSGAPGTIETFLAYDGRPLFVTFAPTRYKKQDVVLCAFADISARAEMERTLALAKEQADKASEAKSTFLATMSHEIRTPLYGVLGTLEVLAMTPLSEDQRRHVDRIQTSSVILQQLISDILDITKIESGQLALEVDTFDPRELFQATVASYAGMAEQKGLIIYSCVDTAVPACVKGDGGRIRQILSNLLSNAIKFTESGHVIARLRAEDLPGGKARLGLQVVDSGVGIGPAEQVRLFEPFYQIDSGSHTIRGAGIGLSICAKLAELMGSTIHVTSEPGLGSSFSVDIELEKADAPACNPPQLQDLNIHVRSPRKELSENICQWLAHWGARATVVPPDAYPDSGLDGVLVDVLLSDNAKPAEWAGLLIVAGGADTLDKHRPQVDRHSMLSIGQAIERLMSGAAEVPQDAGPAAYTPLNLRVLVAEDNPINQVTIRDQLEQLGCRVVIAPDGAEALAMWSIEPFDLVLTDVNMPRMNGYDLAGTLRSRGVTVPIIGVTANAMKEEETRCMAAGMNSWLVKPIDLRSLWRRLRPHADAQGGSAAAPRASGPAPAGAAGKAPAIPSKYRNIFLETMTQDLATLEKSVREANARDMRAVLHRMRGGLAAVELTELQSQSERVENQLRNDGLSASAQENLAALIADMKAMLATV
ncbi:Sensor histidine kinase RcsC [compost metagenome]